MLVHGRVLSLVPSNYKVQFGSKDMPIVMKKIVLYYMKSPIVHLKTPDTQSSGCDYYTHTVYTRMHTNHTSPSVHVQTQTHILLLDRFYTYG